MDPAQPAFCAPAPLEAIVTTSKIAIVRHREAQSLETWDMTFLPLCCGEYARRYDARRVGKGAMNELPHLAPPLMHLRPRCPPSRSTAFAKSRESVRNAIGRIGRLCPPCEAKAILSPWPAAVHGATLISSPRSSAVRVTPRIPSVTIGTNILST